MKTSTSILTLLLVFSSQISSLAQRYLQPVFDEVEVQSNLTYGANYTILSVLGQSYLENLKMDVYSPAGDTETNRPLVLFFHGGKFLPIEVNGLTTVTRTDSFAVEICTRLAKMGYVAASIDYRLGWNPLSANSNVIKSTLVQAIYRGVQDARTCTRYFRKTVAEEGNPYGICPDKITLAGEGMGGGFIALATSLTGGYPDWLIPDLWGSDIDGDGLPDPIISPTVLGDPYGETTTGFNPFNGDTLAVPNHPGFDSDVQLCINLGGAVPDTTWIDTGDPPVISFHVPNDPFVPYIAENIVVHPGNLVMELKGSYRISQKASLTGINQVFTDANIQDEFTAAADTNNDGFEGLFPFLRPDGTYPFDPGSVAYENAPWAWWDSAYWAAVPSPFCGAFPFPQCNFHEINAINNNDMSAEKGRTYTDSIIGYFAPRAYVALGLGNACFTASKDTAAGHPALEFFPNPTSGAVKFLCKKRSCRTHPALQCGWSFDKK